MMGTATYLMVWMYCLDVRDRVVARLDGAEGDEPAGRDRGDVPGWVMVTVMTAILVVAILGIFEPQIKGALRDIIKQVTDAGNKN